MLSAGIMFLRVVYKYCIARWFVVLLVFFAPQAAMAQWDDLDFGHILSQDGLQNSDVLAVLQDEDGFIWFGTEYGLYRYDGKRIKSYINDPDDDRSLANNQITCMLLDRNGDIWVGTARGVSKYERNTDSFLNFVSTSGKPALTHGPVTALANGRDSIIFVSTTEGLNRVNIYTAQVARLHPQGLISNYLRSLRFQEPDRLWIGYERDGLACINLTANSVVNYDIQTPEGIRSRDDAVIGILVSGDTVFAGCRRSGVRLLSISNEEVLEDPLFEFPEVFNTFLQEDEFFFVGTRTGLYVIDTKSRTRRRYVHDGANEKSLSNNGVIALFIDRQRILWAGCSLGGLNYSLRDKAFTYFNGGVSPKDSNNGSTNASISAVFEDSRKKLWLGYFFESNVRVVDLRTGVVEQVKLPIPAGVTSHGTVFSFAEDGNGDILISTYEAGVYVYSPERKRFIGHYYHRPGGASSLPVNDVRALQFDSSGRLWLLLHGEGIGALDPATGKVEIYNTFNQHNSLPSPWVNHFQIDQQSNLWIATPEGLCRFIPSRQEFETFIYEEGSTVVRNIRTVQVDGEDYVWAGTRDGLLRFNLKTLRFDKLFTSKHGFPSNSIAGILKDKGHLWVSTGKGLVKFNPEDESVRSYRLTDGLPFDEFFLNCSFRNSEGRLYFGGIDGLVGFYPDQIKDNEYRPSVVFTDFRINLKSVLPIDRASGEPLNINKSGNIVLRYAENVITFEFAAINFIHPLGNQYQYFLEGFDRGWVSAGDRSEVTYTNLSPGDYLFHIKGSNNDGIWGGERTLAITILPPWYLSSYAYAFYALVFMALCFLAYKFVVWRERLEKKFFFEKLELEKQHVLDRMRLRFFTSVSHEFRTPLTLINGPVERLLEKEQALPRKERVELLSLIKRNSDRLLQLINQILDFRKEEENSSSLNLTHADLLKYIRQLADNFSFQFEKKKIRYTFSSNVESVFVAFDVDKIDKILTNILSNALKFSPAGGKISVSLKKEEINENTANRGKSLVVLEVTDTGGGVPEEQLEKVFEPFFQSEIHKGSAKGSGLGMALVREMVLLHKGEIKIENIYEATQRSGLKITVQISFDNVAPESLQDEDDHMPVTEPAPVSVDEAEEKPIILIVDDNPDIRKFIAGELSDRFLVYETDNGSSGFEMSRQLIPDLIISDVMMPGISGIEFCKQIKTDELTSHIPVILLTALSSQEHHIQGLETGADDFITKPFRSDLLNVRISNLINNRKILQERFSKGVGLQTKSVVRNSADQKFLQKAIRLVEDNLSDPDLDVDKFTRELGVSRAQLYRKIQAVSGQSVKEFIRTIRLKKAAELLVSQNMSISEVSDTVGFNYVQYFSKAFTDQFGISPSRYAEIYTPRNKG